MLLALFLPLNKEPHADQRQACWSLETNCRPNKRTGKHDPQAAGGRGDRGTGRAEAHSALTVNTGLPDGHADRRVRPKAGEDVRSSVCWRRMRASPLRTRGSQLRDAHPLAVSVTSPMGLTEVARLPGTTARNARSRLLREELAALWLACASSPGASHAEAGRTAQNVPALRAFPSSDQATLGRNQVESSAPSGQREATLPSPSPPTGAHQAPALVFWIVSCVWAGACPGAWWQLWLPG